jgi:hypothetical protein
MGAPAWKGTTWQSHSRKIKKGKRPSIVVLQWPQNGNFRQKRMTTKSLLSQWIITGVGRAVCLQTHDASYRNTRGQDGLCPCKCMTQRNSISYLRPSCLASFGPGGRELACLGGEKRQRPTARCSGCRGCPRWPGPPQHNGIRRQAGGAYAGQAAKPAGRMDERAEPQGTRRKDGRTDGRQDQQGTRPRMDGQTDNRTPGNPTTDGRKDRTWPSTPHVSTAASGPRPRQTDTACPASPTSATRANISASREHSTVGAASTAPAVTASAHCRDVSSTHACEAQAVSVCLYQTAQLLHDSTY